MWHARANASDYAEKVDHLAIRKCARLCAAARSAATPDACVQQGRGPVRNSVDDGHLAASQQNNDDDETVSTAEHGLYTPQIALRSAVLSSDGHLYSIGSACRDELKGSPAPGRSPVNDGRSVRKKSVVSMPGPCRDLSYGHSNPQGMAWDTVTGAMGNGARAERRRRDKYVERGKKQGWRRSKAQTASQAFASRQEEPLRITRRRWVPSAVEFYTAIDSRDGRHRLFVAECTSQLCGFGCKKQIASEEVIFGNSARQRHRAGNRWIFYVAAKPHGAGTGRVCRRRRLGVISLVP